MSDKFRQERRAAFTPRQPIDPGEVSEEDGGEEQAPARNPMEAVHRAQRELGVEVPQNVELKGNVPPELREVMGERMPPSASQRMSRMQQQPRQKERETTFNPRDPYAQFKDEKFEEVMKRLTGHHHFDEIVLPSLGKFYEPHQCPAGGKIHIRPMTGAEEQILATPRYVKKGEAIDRIFKACCQESIDPNALLTMDRTYMLIYLRGISYTPDYDVEVKCPECASRFSTTINLNSLNVRECPEDFGPEHLSGVLPTSGFNFVYRLSNGKDEQMVTEHRERRLKEFGDSAADDTLLFRAVLLLDELEGVKSFNALKAIVARLPINDVSYLRNLVNEPPFGVDTEIGIICPNCTAEFDVDMPLEASFFFPRRKKEQARIGE